MSHDVKSGGCALARALLEVASQDFQQAQIHRRARAIRSAAVAAAAAAASSSSSFFIVKAAHGPISNTSSDVLITNCYRVSVI